MKKYDFYLAGAIIVIALVWFLINTKFSENGRFVYLYVNNELAGKYDLSFDKEYTVFNEDGENIQMFEIRDGSVDVISASCPDKLCVHQRAASKSGETIVCLPLKLVLKVEYSDDSGVLGGLSDSSDSGVLGGLSDSSDSGVLGGLSDSKGSGGSLDAVTY